MNTTKKASEIEDTIRVLGEEFQTAAKDIIEPVTSWAVVETSIGMATSTIYLQLTSDMTKHIELTYYNHDCGNLKKGQLVTNVGTFGSFDMTDENSVAEYYTAVGSLLSNKEMLSYLKKITAEFSELTRCPVREFRKLNEED